MSNLDLGAREVIDDYLRRKKLGPSRAVANIQETAAGDVEDFETFEGIEQRPISEVISIIEEKWPEDVSELAQAIVKRIEQAASRGDPLERQRQRNIDAANQALDDSMPSEYVGDGVPDDTKGFGQLRDRPEHPTVKKARDAVGAWLRGEANPMLVLIGPTGVSKTHLAQAAAAQLKAQGKGVVYRAESHMVEQIGATFRGDNTDQTIQAFSRCIWLIVDDFGQTAKGPKFKDIWDRIIDDRWEAAGARYTLLTTNLLLPAFDVRIESRLADVERSQVVTIDAPDYRKERSGG